MEAAATPGMPPETAISAATRSRAAFELKGVMTSLTVLRLKSRDTNMIERQLKAKVTQMPSFFQDAPVVVDLGGLEGGLADLSLGVVVHMLRACRVVPVGVINIADEDREAARVAGLGLLPSSARPDGDGPADGRVGADAVPMPAARLTEPSTAHEKKSRRGDGKQDPRLKAALEVAAPVAHGHLPPLVLREPVRSGQVIYAQNTDLIVLAPVNPGAQIFADGHIHCYAPLRGRAMAGSKGLTEARIFCQKLEPEMVAIAGAFLMSDEISEDRLGKPAQIYLEKGECRVTTL